MTDGLRALLEGAIDYAGLFPPAQLGLDEAIRNYARYRQDADTWMLGRFVLPAARLGELDPHLDTLFASATPLGLAVLGRGGDTLADWTAGLKEDARTMAAWRLRHGGLIRIGTFEIRLPREASVTACLKVVADVLGPTPPAFFEASLPGEALSSRLAAVVDEIGAGGGGFKYRCGGPNAAAFPTAGAVALVLRTCRQARVPLKLTAGLHHPLPRFDAGVQATMHGFVNVLAAGVFAGSTPDADLAALLQDADPSHFSFAGGVSWRELAAPRDQVVVARREGILSFGSCSFDEPRADLRALGWL
jgi:hypothetical protein